nr:hypothetical protein [Bradyrhizobium sp. WSM4349]
MVVTDLLGIWANCNRAWPCSETGTRAHVASKILDAAKTGEITADRLRQVGMEALRSAPTMWR